jgi:hypothetical protein
MRIAIWPLRVPVTPGSHGGSWASLPGYRCVARVDLESLLRERFLDQAAASPRQRLAALILLVRGEASQGLTRLARSHRETLEDTLREAAARLDPRALGLPAFALVHGGTTADSLPEPDPVTAIALLTRTAGTVFVAGRSPRLAGLERELAVHCYLVPVPRQEVAP